MWNFIGSSFGDNFVIDGIDIFTRSWIDTGRKVEVHDPLYNQKFIFTVWKIKKENKEITFASGEFSNNVYGIYMEKTIN